MILILKNYKFDIWITDLEIYAVKLWKQFLKFFFEIKNFSLKLKILF